MPPPLRLASSLLIFRSSRRTSTSLPPFQPHTLTRPLQCANKPSRPSEVDESECRVVGSRRGDDPHTLGKSRLVQRRVSRTVNEDDQVLLVRRVSSASFMPNVFVFPGGVVDEADQVPVAGEAVEVGAVLQVAGAAEHQGGPPTPAALSALHRAALRETEEETGMSLAPPAHAVSATTVGGSTIPCSALTHWAWWQTPRGEGTRRYDTHFFIAHIDAADATATGGSAGLPPTLTLAPDELDDAVWISPSQAIALHARGLLPLAPPTWHMLADLAARGGPTSGQPTQVERLLPQFASRDTVLLPGDAEYKLPLLPSEEASLAARRKAAAGHAPRRRLLISRVPDRNPKDPRNWRYTMVSDYEGDMEGTGLPATGRATADATTRTTTTTTVNRARL